VVIVSATGGSGSSFIVSSFIKGGWNVCVRPDGGHQKIKYTVDVIWKKRVSPFFITKTNTNTLTQKERFELTYEKLRHKKNIVLVCMTWGGMGFLKDLDEKAIYLIRNPVFAFNSYSGGGWRKDGGMRRIKYVGASSPNSKKWIDAFLGDFSFWVDGAENALKACKNGNGTIIRYHRLKEDWKQLDGFENICGSFHCKDKEKKVTKYLTKKTIRYIKNKTKDIWGKILNYEKST